MNELETNLFNVFYWSYYFKQIAQQAAFDLMMKRMARRLDEEEGKNI